MFSKTTFLMTFAAMASLATAAGPPGCLLGAVNTYQDPADLSAVCKSSDATGKITKYCGDAASGALEAFAEICNGAGVEVSTDVSSEILTATGTLKPSATGYFNGTTSGVAQATGTGSPSGAPGAPGGGNGPAPSGIETGGPPESTGAAGKLQVGVAAVLAGLGVMAAAL